MDCNCRLVEKVLRLARTKAQTPTQAEETGLRLASKVSDAGADDEFNSLRLTIPQDLATFWRETREALFLGDVDYDQWGLHILDPGTAAEVTAKTREDRSDDFESGDLVVGTFRGDSDLILIRMDSASADFGTIVVGLPLDERDQWFYTGLCLGQFLDRFVATGGQKFWEHY